MLTREFWVAATERAVKTAAQALAVLWVIGDDGLFDLLAVDWRAALSAAGGALVASYLTSVVSAPIGPVSSPSLVGYTDQN